MAVKGSSEFNAQIVCLYVKHGMSTRRIAESQKVSRQLVTAELQRAGVSVAPRGAGRHRPLRVESPITEASLRYLYTNSQLSSVEIGRALGVSDRFVRSRLKFWGIERRTSGQWNRYDRSDVASEELRRLYLEKEWTAWAVGEELGVSGRIVLRSAHSEGLPVRAGGSHRPAQKYDIALVEALYGDYDVSLVLEKYSIPIVREPGPIWQRFPTPVALSRDLLSSLYVECGLSTFHIELLTGVPLSTILRRLDEFEIVRRGRGGRSPFMRRLTARQK